jgi:hypothetical protein
MLYDTSSRDAQIQVGSFRDEKYGVTLRVFKQRENCPLSGEDQKDKDGQKDL